MEHGPTRAYYAGYLRVNAALDHAAAALVERFVGAGHEAQWVRSTVPEDEYGADDDWADVPVFAHGSRRRCVDACPAGAGIDRTWRAGLAREALYDVKACEEETNKYEHLDGICGVCIAVCPWGRDKASHR